MRVSVRVEGLREFQSALRKADKLLPRQIRLGLNEVAELVADEAARRVPVRTGALRDSIRPQSTQREGRVAMGSARVPYAGWIEFGGRIRQGNRVIERDWRKDGRYLFPVADEMRGRINKETTRVLNQLAEKAGLD